MSKSATADLDAVIWNLDATWSEFAKLGIPGSAKGERSDAVLRTAMARPGMSYSPAFFDFFTCLTGAGGGSDPAARRYSTFSAFSFVAFAASEALIDSAPIRPMLQAATIQRTMASSANFTSARFSKFVIQRDTL
jgi:hypothetical protein